MRVARVAGAGLRVWGGAGERAAAGGMDFLLFPFPPPLSPSAACRPRGGLFCFALLSAPAPVSFSLLRLFFAVAAASGVGLGVSVRVQLLQAAEKGNEAGGQTARSLPPCKNVLNTA
jgi:hypothetical protein